ncbi:hypothetical protein GCM10009001_27850 [Virgibacillus siamensis]|uniref:DUF2508 family protein n=1 Tax=Virgibacillus siamensis TaxID=480071 RepID=A0ABP3REB0_9BACI
MAKKVKKRTVDEQLLQSIFALEREWKQIQAILGKSVESSYDGMFTEKLAREKYLYLLREARRRKISAVRYSK